MKSNRVSKIEGVKLTQMNRVSDSRGSFMKFHPTAEIADPLESVAISLNQKSGTIRGLHFQVEPFAEEKLVSCLYGSIFDVIVDLRPNSRTCGKWSSFVLSSENALQVYLPKGIAHGFQTLVPDSIVHYILSAGYSAESSYVVNPLGGLGINWPLETMSISERDASGIELSVAARIYADSLES